MTEDLPDPLALELGESPAVTGGQVAGVGVGFNWWNPFDYYRYATAGAVLTSFIMGQTSFNLDFFWRQIRGSGDPGNTFWDNLYRWSNSSFSPQRFRDLQKFVDALPEPYQSMMFNGTMTLDSWSAMCRDKHILALAKRALHDTHGAGPLYDDAYNHCMLAEDKKGDIKRVDYDRIISMFHKTPPNELPRIIFTASHTKSEKFKNVTEITHGIESMARYSWGKKLDLITPDQEPRKGSTMILFASDTEKHFWLNGIALQERLNEIEHSLNTGEPDQFRYICPGSKRIALLMLACMCKNYYQEDGTRLFDIDDPRPLSEIFADGRRVELSSDASHISQHFQQVGYSKAGTTVSDTMRYLDAQLHATVNGRPVVKFPAEKGYHPGPRNVLANIMTASIAAREYPLTEELKQHGVQRVAFNNKYDHLTQHYAYKSTWNDEFYLIEGTEDKNHEPDEAMGTREKCGYIMDEKRTHENNCKVHRRMQEFFAPHYGKWVITNLFAEHGKVKFETATGTADGLLVDHGSAITEALEEAGLTNVRLTGNGHMGIAELHCKERLTHNPAALNKLGAAFGALRKHESGLVIGQKINDVDIPSLRDKAKMTAKTSAGGNFIAAAVASRRGKPGDIHPPL